jgi:hypothetical protein
VQEGSVPAEFISTKYQLHWDEPIRVSEIIGVMCKDWDGLY